MRFSTAALSASSAAICWAPGPGRRSHLSTIYSNENPPGQSDTLEAGQMAEEFLTRAHAQDSSQTDAWK
jgi:hypothetical protein